MVHPTIEHLASYVHPETPVLPLPLDGGGKGGGDHIPESQDYPFWSPSPQPSPARGEEVSG